LEIFCHKEKTVNNNNLNNYNEPEATLEEDVIEAFNVDLENSEKFSFSKILEETVNVLFYLVSDHYDDLKPGFHLILLFVEKIHKKNFIK